MKKLPLAVVVLTVSYLCMGLIVRHDVSLDKFISLGKDYPQICHLADGEGALIAQNWVLTAAHAAVVLKEELDNGLTPEVIIDEEQYPVEKVVLHPNFELTNTSITSDIALIKIKKAVTHIPIAKLYNDKDEKGKQIVLVGRGDFGTGLTGPQKTDKITRAATNRVDGTRGDWIYFTFDAPGSDNATPMEGVSGPGDSGGPAFVDIAGERYILGVSSHQMDNGQEGVYGVIENYTRVSAYKTWITEQIQ
ncbi:S1 family peptidase [Spongiimicrobium sp. 3-5]|uniref:S1 family peptidase n=1 Tax=Spongiimicrobium sp. 3-5 TaxID=3332596 RepID=UPI00397F151D